VRRDLLEQQHRATQPPDRARQRLLGHVLRRKQVAHRDQLAQRELEPQLIDLVDRDEHDLVIREVRLRGRETVL
jgi:hypothetical protein